MTILKCIFEKAVPCLDCIQLVGNARFFVIVIEYLSSLNGSEFLVS